MEPEPKPEPKLAPAARAILLLAHGSRSPKAREELEAWQALLERRLAPHPVSLAYLEINDPRLPQAADSLVARGAHEILLLPLLVTQGNHVLQDIPAALDAIRARHPQLVIETLPHLGALDGFLELMEKSLRARM